MNTQIQRRFVRAMTLVLPVLLLVGVMEASADGPRESHITDAGRLQLAIQLLQDAINSPNDINLTYLKMITDDPDFDQVRDEISALLASDRDSIRWDRVTLEAVEVTDSKGGFQIATRLLYETAAGIAEDTLEFDAIKKETTPRFKNLSASLTKAHSFVAEERKKLPRLTKDRMRPLSRTSIELQNPLSNRLLCPIDLDSGVFNGQFHRVGRFNDTANDTLFENTIFNRPYGLLAFRYLDQLKTFDFLIVTDANWDRAIVADQNNRWLTSVGSSGTGSNNFRNPTGIAWSNWKFYVADAYNDRICQYYFNSGSQDPEAEFVMAFQDGFDLPVDVAAASFVIDGAPYYYPVVLDQGNNRVIVYKRGLISDSAVVLPDPILGTSLNSPTSVCYGRHPVTHAPTQQLYVADNGNNRIITFNTQVPELQPLSYYETAPGTFPADAYLACVDVDNFGFVHVLDARNNVIYKFDYILQELVAKYNSESAEDGSFLFPNRMAFARVAQYNSAGPSLFSDAGDVFVTEHFGTDTGIRRYVSGFNVLSSSTEYIPKYRMWNHDYIRCKYYSTGYTNQTVHIYNNDTLVQSWSHHCISPRENWATWELPDSASDGFYVFKVDLESIYESSNDTTLWDSIEVERFVDTSFVGCRVVRDSVVVESPMNDQLGDCLYIGSETFYRATVYSHDLLTGEPIDGPFTWHQYGNHLVGFYRDSANALLDENGIEDLTTDSNWVWFRVIGDTNYTAPQEETIFLGFAGLEDSGQVARSSPEASLHLTDAYADSCGVSRVNVVVYGGWCNTPCASCACPFLYSWNGEKYEFVNNILPQCETYETAKTDQRDYYPVYDAKPEKTGYYKFLITEEEQEISYLNELEVLAFDYYPTPHDPVINSGRELVAPGDTCMPISAITSGGEDVLKSLSARDGNRLVSSQPGFVEVEYNMPARTRQRTSSLLEQDPDEPAIIIDPPGKGSYPKVSAGYEELSSNYYSLYCQSQLGEWELAELVPPRIKGKRQYVDVSGYVNEDKLKLRLEWSESVDLDWLPYVSCEAVETTPVKLKLMSAVHSGSGDRTSQLDKDDDSRMTLRPGEQIELTYKAESPPQEGQRRVFLFGAKGWYKSYDSRTDGPIEEGLPSSLTLEQNYPNPFNPVTTFHFALPSAEHVTFEIFNVLGQRVMILIDADYGAGEHTVQWDCKMDDGQSVASGVYFARLKAGEAETTRKMMVVK